MSKNNYLLRGKIIKRFALAFVSITENE